MNKQLEQFRSRGVFLCKLSKANGIADDYQDVRTMRELYLMVRMSSFAIKNQQICNALDQLADEISDAGGYVGR